MLRRLLIVAGIALALVLGARFALAEVTERAWARRRAELAALALPPETLRRPWEVRYEALAQRLSGSERFDEIVDSPHRPQVAWGGAAPRPLDEFEALWVAAANAELAGLDSILRDLRTLPVEDLAWHGEPVQLLFLREVVDLLCARAWLAASQGEHAAAARDYADALRLAQATDGGSLIGTMMRFACQVGVALPSLRGALELGLSALELRPAVMPLLAAWAYDPVLGERGIRGELSAFLDGMGERVPDDPLEALHQFRTIEEALALARTPLASSPFGTSVEGQGTERSELDGSNLWGAGVRQLHAFHAARNVALTALAVAAHREAQGQWPTSLDELDLPAEQALDPLSGAPLPYSFTAERARVGPAAWAERVEPWDDVDRSPYAWTLDP